MIDGWNDAGGELPRVINAIGRADEVPRVLIAAAEVKQVDHPQQGLSTACGASDLSSVNQGEVRISTTLSTRSLRLRINIYYATLKVKLNRRRARLSGSRPLFAL